MDPLRNITPIHHLDEAAPRNSSRCASAPDATGLVLVFTDYQAFAVEFKREAHVLLDIIAGQSRHALIRGEQVFCLVHAEDPRFTLPAVGAVPLRWNQAEWLNASRGL